MECETILFAKDGMLATITLNRPEKLNAINNKMISELDCILARVAGDSAVKALVITGGEIVFVSGPISAKSLR